jgi:glutathione S-transferase
MPFIEADGERIADSTFIRGFIERTCGVDFDEGLDARQRAEAWAVERMVENQLCWIGSHARWLIPANFETGPARFFDSAPDATRDHLRADVLDRVRATMLAVGVGRHSEPEIVALGVRSLAALSVILDGKPFLMGSRPCGADATVFAVLAMILTPHFESELRRRARAFGNLVAYVDRLMAQFYPEFPWNVAAPRAAVAA